MAKIGRSVPIEIDGTKYDIRFKLRTAKALEDNKVALGSDDLEAAGVDGQIKLVQVIMKSEHGLDLSADDVMDGMTIFDLNDFGRELAEVFNPESGAGFPTATTSGSTAGQSDE